MKEDERASLDSGWPEGVYGVRSVVFRDTDHPTFVASKNFNRDRNRRDDPRELTREFVRELLDEGELRQGDYAALYQYDDGSGRMFKFTVEQAEAPLKVVFA